MTGIAVVGLLAASLTGGCGYSYKQTNKEVAEKFHRGDYAGAAAQSSAATAGAQSGANRNHLLAYELEEGSTNLAAGKPEVAVAALDKAEDLFIEYDKRAATRLDREIWATLTNPMAVEYEGRGHERIMVNAYLALSHLQTGNATEARRTIFATAEAQKANEFRFRKAIEQDQKLQAENQKNQSGADVNRVQKDPNFERNQGKFLEDFPELASASPIPPERYRELWVNPFAEYLQGLFFLYSSASGDREVGRVALRNTAGLVPADNKFVLADAAHAEAATQSRKPAPRVYVLFETGMAPYRQEIRIDLPIFLISLSTNNDIKVDYVPIAFAVLKKQDGAVDYMTVATPEGKFYTKTLADFDRIIGREFKEELPGMITRTIISTVTKAAIQYGVAKSLEKQDDWVQIAARAAVAISQAILNEAEVRGWRTLPKQVQVASFPTPAAGKVDLAMQGGAPFTSVNVSPGKSTIIWVRSGGDRAPAVVKMIPLD